MEELLNDNPGIPNVVFSNDVVGELALCSVIFVAVDVRLSNRPKQVRGDMDVRNLEDAIKAVLASMGGNLQEKYIAVKSTLPVDYRGDFISRLSRYPHFDRLNIVINPEFFATGNAVRDLREPQRVVFGSFHRAGIDIFQPLYLPLVHYDLERIVILPLHSAEIGKLLSNAAKASQLTVVNIGSTLCEKIGCRFSDVRNCLNLNPEHQSQLTQPMPGFGGLGLNKDVAYLAFLCEVAGLEVESLFFRGILRMRREMMDHLVQTILSKIGSVKRIGWYGFASKVGTDDLQESPSIYLCSALLKAHDMSLVVHDFVVMMDDIPQTIPHYYRARVRSVEMPDEVWNNRPQAIVFMHNHEEYRTMVENDHPMMIGLMRDPKHIFDCCGLLDQVDPVILQYILDRTNVYRLGMPVV